MIREHRIQVGLSPAAGGERHGPERARAALDGQHELALWLGQVLFGDAEVAKLEAAAFEAVPAPKSLGGLKQSPTAKAAGKAKEKKVTLAKRGRTP